MIKKLPSQILTLFEEYKISEKELKVISNYLKEIYLKKQDKFSVKGEVCSKLGILTNGLLYASYKSENKDSNISRFYYLPDNIFVTSYSSFKNKTSSFEKIVAIEDSNLVYILKSDLEKLRKIVPKINLLICHFAETSYITALDRIHDLQVLDAPQRVDKFLASKKNLYNRIGKQLIASYLRVNRNDLTKFVKQLKNSI